MYNPNPYRNEVLYSGDLRRSPNPVQAIAAQVNWEIVAAFIILIGFCSFLLWQNQPSLMVPATVGLILVGWVFSLCLHEFAHAATAYIGGDHSDSTRSYLSFNPLKYLHPVLSILLPIFFILLGGIPLPGGAVYINRNLVRGRVRQSAISLAGPLMNGLVAVVASIPFWLGITNDHPALGDALALLVFFQVFSVVLNILPIPPLDGYGIISPWLPRELQQTLYTFANFGILLIFAALWLVPPIAEQFYAFVFNVMAVLGVDPDLAINGLFTFQFWQH
ncbi:MAG: site-2 protease family protein [Ktedonobacterales bacterium]